MTTSLLLPAGRSVLGNALGPALRRQGLRCLSGGTPAAHRPPSPSRAVLRASPRVASILAGYVAVDPSRRRRRSPTAKRGAAGENDDVSKVTPKVVATRTTGVSDEEMAEWETPHMPILTDRQLELSLAEIRRRNERRRKRREVEGSREKSSTSSRRSREAAILVPLCTVEGVPSILFTRRSAKLSSHASQISFPGGYYDEDLDCITKGGRWEDKMANAAIREMHEELQYDVHKMGMMEHAGDGSCLHEDCADSSDKSTPPFVTILGRTRPVPSMTGARVTPIIGAINYDLPNHTSPMFREMCERYSGREQRSFSERAPACNFAPSASHSGQYITTVSCTPAPSSAIWNWLKCLRLGQWCAPEMVPPLVLRGYRSGG